MFQQLAERNVGYDPADFATILVRDRVRTSDDGVKKTRWRRGGFALGQDGASQRSVLLIIANYLEALYIETGFPTFLAMYHVLDGPKAPGRHYSLT
jgi:hypothetical protein